MKRLVALLSICALARVSVSALRVKTVDSQPGKEATLTCSRICQQSCLTFWFKWVSGTNAVCVSVMIEDGAKPGYCEGYKSGKFVMGVTNSSVFLNITQVDVSDSGSYFCGFYTEGLLYFTGVQLNIKGDNESYEKDNHTHGEKLDSLPMICMGCLSTFLLMIIIGLIVKLRKLQRAHKPQKTPTTLERNDFEEIEELKYATVAFQPKQGRQRRDAEPNVIYSATRLNRN
ncbi:uncharacterized protein [Takifugu rubripes]|uniref:uncharacterized protein n=1 Tax=Takifugu rubripes TaxID=31033 RepID=UPI001145DAF6|nr:uncharacterized protein LOC101067077 [Takifugu rubripes]